MALMMEWVGGFLRPVCETEPMPTSPILHAQWEGQEEREASLELSSPQVLCSGKGGFQRTELETECLQRYV